MFNIECKVASNRGTEQHGFSGFLKPNINIVWQGKIHKILNLYIIIISNMIYLFYFIKIHKKKFGLKYRVTHKE